MMVSWKTAVLALCVAAVHCQEQCTKDGVPGRCTNISDCPAAIRDIQNRKKPQICWFEGSDPVVCCVSSGQGTTSPRPVATTSTTRPQTTTMYVPMEYVYENNDDSPQGCAPIPPGLTSPKTNQIAWNKCLEYQEKYVYPCEKEVSLTGGMARVSHCNHNADDLIIGGVDAGKQEFPHMVLLGFGETAESAKWLCGGTLISDRFVLTAGHCTSSREEGPVTNVRLGAYRRTEQVDSTRVHKVGRIIKHPDYKPPAKYNDIALLETVNEIKLDQFAVPACLDVGGERATDRAAATGWGLTKYRGQSADILQKVILTKFTNEECAIKFPANRNMLQGFISSTQMCYGDKNQSKDTCQGDSGGPLQIKNKKINCMYTIIGVTSFGKACGFVGDPGIYTRVQPFVSWIESVVWPQG